MIKSDKAASLLSSAKVQLEFALNQNGNEILCGGKWKTVLSIEHQKHNANCTQLNLLCVILRSDICWGEKVFDDAEEEEITTEP